MQNTKKSEIFGAPKTGSFRGFKVTEEKENLLFNRKEFFFEVQANITPSRFETLKFVSEKFSAPIENIKIKSINGKFGSNMFSGSVFIYNSEEDKNRLEIKKKKDEKIKEALSKPEKEEVKEEKIEEKNSADVDMNKDDNPKTTINDSKEINKNEN